MIIIDQQFLSVETLNEIYQSTNIGEFDWDEYIEPYDFTTTDIRVIDFLILHHLGLTTLSHKEMPPKYLIKLSKLGCDDALYTLGRMICQDSTLSHSQFAKLAEEFANNYDVYFYLLEHINMPLSNKKLLLYLGSISSNSILREYIQTCIDAEIVSFTNNETAISAAYETNDYHLLLGIAKNLFTPSWILEELSLCSNVKYSNKIRTLSRETYKKKCSIT